MRYWAIGVSFLVELVGVVVDVMVTLLHRAAPGAPLTISTNDGRPIDRSGRRILAAGRAAPFAPFAGIRAAGTG
jgi:hypothetical protein